MADGQSYIKRAEALFSSTHFTNNASITQDVNTLFLPRRSDVQTQKLASTLDGWYDHLYETAPIEIARTLAQGQYDLLFTGNWFECQKPGFDADDESHEQDVSYAEIGKRMRKRLGRSNFNLEIQEFLADRSTANTSVIMEEEDEDEVIFFSSISPGRYAIDENHKKRVDVLCLRFKLTARQVIQRFTKETDTIPKSVRTAHAQKDIEKKFEFYHFIEPRNENEIVAGSDIPREMPWASVYISKDDNSIVRDWGYMEQPFMVSRFDRWGESPYGTGPSHIELPRARSLQKIKQTWLALGDRITRPGVFVSEDQEYLDVIKPNGPTKVSREDAALGLPKEWNTGANYEVNKDVLNEEITAMEETFFIPLFKLLLSDTDREKTAFEVQKMLEEQVGRAAPTFSRLDQEVILPLLKRTFNIMLRAGDFDDLLEEISIVDEENGETVGIAEPEIVFTSKLAAAMKAVQSNSVAQFLSSLGFVIEINQTVLDNTDWDKTYRRMWKNFGLPVDELKDSATVKEDRQRRMQAEEAMLAAEAAKNAGQAQQALSA